MSVAGSCRCLIRDVGAATDAAIALTLSLALPLAFGVSAYSQYHLLADDAARASIAGLDADERRMIVCISVARAATALRGGLVPARLTVTTIESDTHVAVRVRYDAGAMALFQTSFLPSPSRTIDRVAMVRPGWPV